MTPRQIFFRKCPAGTASWHAYVSKKISYKTGEKWVKPIFLRSTMSTTSAKASPVDQGGSAGRQGGDSAPPSKKRKVDRENMSSSFHIRLTAEKVAEDQWINGSHETAPELVHFLAKTFEKGGVNFEQGDNGQKHFQITVLLKKGVRMRRSAVRALLEEQWPTLQFPKQDYCEGCQKALASLNYCTKTKTALCEPFTWGGVDIDLKLSDMPTPLKWQEKFIERYTPEPPTNQKWIDWYSDPEGQHGKTEAAKFGVMKLKFYLLAGGAEKMKSQAAKHPSRRYVVNLVRKQEAYPPYGGIEAVHDAFYADTFGGDMLGMVVRKRPWFVVFANFSPDESQLCNRLRHWVWDEETQDFILQK